MACPLLPAIVDIEGIKDDNANLDDANGRGRLMILAILVTAHREMSASTEGEPASSDARSADSSKRPRATAARRTATACWRSGHDASSPCMSAARYRDKVAASIPRPKWFLRVALAARPERPEQDEAS